MLAMIFDAIKELVGFFFLITDFWLLLKTRNILHYWPSIPKWNVTKPIETNENA